MIYNFVVVHHDNRLCTQCSFRQEEFLIFSKYLSCDNSIGKVNMTRLDRIGIWATKNPRTNRGLLGGRAGQFSICGGRHSASCTSRRISLACLLNAA